MTTDALDPGPNGDYPNLPRNPDGSLDTVRMPIGLRVQITPDGERVLIDVTPGITGGRRVTDVAAPPPGGGG